MCFSATASFSAAALLGSVGAATIARNASPQHRMYAAIPLMFGMQQAAEGVVWRTMLSGEHGRVHPTAVSVFLAFALVVWPTWLPVSLHRIERSTKRRQILKYLVYCGTLVSICALLLMARQQPEAGIVGRSITYKFAGNPVLVLQLFMTVAYFVPTILPVFVSTSSMSRAIGVALAGSVVLSYVVQHNALTSVWCFFAAFVSALVYLAVEREQHAAPVGDRALTMVRGRFSGGQRR